MSYINKARQLVELLLSDPRGQIIVYNMLASLNEKLISEDLLKQFLGCCIKAFKEDNVTRIDDLISLFADVARGVRPIKSFKKKFLLSCKKLRSHITKDSTLYNVMEYGTLRMFFLKDSISIADHEYRLCNPDPTDITIEETINQLNDDVSDNKYQLGARLGGGAKHPFFWITLYLEEEQKVKSSKKYADYIRDIMGLIHYKVGQSLIVIQIPGEIIIKHKNSRPTFIDAIKHRRFRVLPDTQQARSRTGWGHTVDLAKFANNRDTIDGVPERVVEPIDCNADLELKFKYIGKITSKRGDSNRDNDEIFVKRLNTNNINTATLKREIVRFLI